MQSLAWLIIQRTICSHIFNVKFVIRSTIHSTIELFSHFQNQVWHSSDRSLNERLVFTISKSSLSFAWSFTQRTTCFHIFNHFKSFISFCKSNIQSNSMHSWAYHLHILHHFASYLNIIEKTSFIISMKRHFLSVKKRKVRNATRQRRWRIKRKTFRLQFHSKKRVDFLDDFQVIVQRRFSSDFVHASNTLSQIETNMIKNMINWFFKFYKDNNSKKSKIKTITSSWWSRKLDYKNVNVVIEKRMRSKQCRLNAHSNKHLIKRARRELIRKISECDECCL